MEPIAIYAVAGAVVAAILVQVFAAQVWSRRTIHSVRASTVQQHGTSIPYLGHLFQLLFYGDRFLQQARDSALPSSNFAVQLLGNAYNFIYAPQTTKAAQKLKGTSVDTDTLTLQALENAFSLPSTPPALDAALKLVSSELRPEVQRSLTASIIKSIQTQLADFVSFMSALIDQSSWERNTIISVSEDHDTATVAFSELLRNFISHHILQSLLPAHLLETHPHAQTFVEDLWKVNSATFLLALGLPRWVPIPRLTTAHIARRNLLWTLSGLCSALDALLDNHTEPVGEWQNLDVEDVSPFLRDFHIRYKSVPADARATLLLANVLALCTRVANLAFWSVANLYADPVLLAQLREETRANGAAVAEQPASDFGIAEPVRLRLDADALQKSATLQAAYVESVRLYDKSFDLMLVKETCSLADSGDSDALPEIRLSKGTYLVDTAWLYNTDPSEFLHAGKWWPERHLSLDSVDDGEVTVSQGLMAKLAGGEDSVKALSLAFVAGFVAVWDVELKGGLPKTTRSVSICGPKGDVPANVRRRELPSSKSTN